MQNREFSKLLIETIQSIYVFHLFLFYLKKIIFFLFENLE